MGDDLITQLEFDLLNHLITGCETHADGTPIRWGAWMTACLETLVGLGYVKRRAGAYEVTDAGRIAVSQWEEAQCQR